MIFLGQASTFKFTDVLRHTFAYGNKNDLRELRAYLAAHYGTTKDRVAIYHTGRTALAVALDKLVPADSEVIITSLTCYAVYQAVSEVSCIPVFADIDKSTMHFGPKELKNTLKEHPDARAVIVQNNLGIPADMKAIEKICRDYNLILIEDLAHSAGVHYHDGREAGTVGDAAVLSFGKGKSIDTISGGAVVFMGEDAPTVPQPTRRPRLSDRLRDRFYPLLGLMIRGFYHLGNLGRLFTSLLLKIHFIKRSADAELEPMDRITCWQAKLALHKLKQLPRAGRKPIRDFYYVEDRVDLLQRLESAGYVLDDIWYNCPVSPVRYYARVNFPEEDCPNAVWAAQHVVNVPTWYPKKDLKRAVELIKRYPAEEEPVKKVTHRSSEEDRKPEKKTRKTTEKSIPTEKASTKTSHLDLELALQELGEAPEEYEENLRYKEAPEEYETTPKHAKEPDLENADVYIVEERDELGGTINYSELVYDKYDHTHLNRTNIIDKNINSDGTYVSLTKEERKPKRAPIKNNLPKIRQYKKPEKGPETTEGKVW